MGNIIAFDEVVKRMTEEVPEDLKNTKILSEIELQWQTALLNMANDVRSDDISGSSGRDKITFLNRFFEFDAGDQQPIFKSVSVDYKKCHEYVYKLLGTNRPEGYIEQVVTYLTETLSGKRGGEKLAQVNIVHPDTGVMTSTSWAVNCFGDDNILSTVIIVPEWDLWRDAIRDIVAVFLVHISVAKIVGAKPGPISFACNRITLHVADHHAAVAAASAYRNLVQIHAIVDHYMELYRAINSPAPEREAHEVDSAFEDRLERHAEMVKKAKEAVSTIDKDYPVDLDMFNMYCVRYIFQMSENHEGIKDIFDTITLPDVCVINTAPRIPV